MYLELNSMLMQFTSACQLRVLLINSWWVLRSRNGLQKRKQHSKLELSSMVLVNGAPYWRIQSLIMSCTCGQMWISRSGYLGSCLCWYDVWLRFITSLSLHCNELMLGHLYYVHNMLVLFWYGVLDRINGEIWAWWQMDGAPGKSLG